MYSDGPEVFSTVRTSRKPHGGLQLAGQGGLCLSSQRLASEKELRMTGCRAYCRKVSLDSLPRLSGCLPKFVSVLRLQKSKYQREASYLPSDWRPKQTSQLSPTMMPVWSLLLEALWMKPGALHMLDKESTTELHPNLACSVLLRDNEFSE